MNGLRNVFVQMFCAKTSHSALLANPASSRRDSQGSCLMEAALGFYSGEAMTIQRDAAFHRRF